MQDAKISLERIGEIHLKDNETIIEENNIKITQLVECPDCNKKMTSKSLRYSHKNNCSANKAL